MSREKLDILISRWTSRKLMVFVISTIALFTGHIDADNFVIVSSAYVGVEGFIDAVIRLKGLKQN